MTLSNEQREEMISSKLSDIRNKSEFGRVVLVQANTTHDLMADIRFLLEIIDQSRSSEQAWKEENADTDRALLEVLDRVHELESDINTAKFQLNQAIEVLKVLKYAMPTLNNENEHPKVRENLLTRLLYRIDECLSSPSQEKEETT